MQGLIFLLAVTCGSAFADVELKIFCRVRISPTIGLGSSSSSDDNSSSEEYDAEVADDSDRGTANVLGEGDGRLKENSFGGTGTSLIVLTGSDYFWDKLGAALNSKIG